MATETTPLHGGGGGLFDIAFRVRVMTSVASLAEGYDIGVINGALILMQPELGLSDWEAGVIVGVLPLFTAIFALMSGTIMDTIGRKPSLGLSSLALVVGNLIWAFGAGFKTVLAARCILGAGCGLGIATVTVFLSEVAPAHTRGFYVSLEELFMNVGILSGFASGAFLVGFQYEWRIMVGIGAIPAVATLICVCTPCCPESPRYLQASGRLEEAKTLLLELLHGDKPEADKVFREWVAEDRQPSNGWWTVICTFCQSHRKRALAGFGVGFFMMAGGVTIVTSYSALMFKKYGMTNGEQCSVVVGVSNPLRASVVVGMVKLGFIFISAFYLLDSWGRRPLFLISAAGCAFGFSWITMACYLQSSVYMLAAGLCIFCAFFSLGMGPVTYVYMGEVFDNQTRAKGVAAALFASRIIQAIYGTTFPVLLDWLGDVPVFGYLVVVNLLAVAFYFVFCPETKGRTLEQVHEVFGSPGSVKKQGAP